jgi:hypothetical protein
LKFCCEYTNDLSERMKPKCFHINAADNVATLLEDAKGVVQVFGAAPQEILLVEPIACGHKVALWDVAIGEPVVKFGVRIGHATKPIKRGTWVHLHNLASDLDERSSKLDLHSGAPQDTAFAYV